MIKPRIKKETVGWSCNSCVLSAFGQSPADAYRLWDKARGLMSCSHTACVLNIQKNKKRGR